MTNSQLAQTALEFCRECLGWDSRLEFFPNGYHLVETEGHSDFNYTNLNTVLEAVRVWCRDSLSDFYVLDITYYKPVPDVVDDIYIVTLRTNRTTVEAKSLNLCHALLTACVEAARKLRA